MKSRTIVIIVVVLAVIVFAGSRIISFQGERAALLEGLQTAEPSRRTHVCDDGLARQYWCAEAHHVHKADTSEAVGDPGCGHAAERVEGRVARVVLEDVDEYAGGVERRLVASTIPHDGCTDHYDGP